jgi:hypothetical protein
MYGIWERADLRSVLVGPIRYLCLLIALVLALTSFEISAGDAIRYGGADLRAKVVGARALLSGLDPYLESTLRWTRDTPLRLSDPETVIYPGLSRVTYAPTLLMFYMPLANLPYKFQRFFWFGLEWLAMATLIVGLATSIKDKNARLCFLLAALICFVGSAFWRFHVERGQYYIFVALLVSFDFIALRKSNQESPWLGLATGVAVALRPTMLAIFPLLWLAGFRRAMLRGGTAAAMIVLATAPFASGAQWLHYAQNVSAHAAKVAADELLSDTIIREHLHHPEELSTVIEGYDFKFNHVLPFNAANLSICGIMRERACLNISLAAAFTIPLAAMLILTIAGGYRAPRELVLLILALVFVIEDYSVPERWDYADVIFLPMIAVLIPVLMHRRSLPLMIFLGSALLTCIVTDEGDIAMLRQVLFLAAAFVGVIQLWPKAHATDSPNEGCVPLTHWGYGEARRPLAQVETSYPKSTSLI